MEAEPKNLRELLVRLQTSINREERVSVGLLVDTVGRRTFGPLLVVVGLTILSPLGAIPGAPTTLSALIILVALQLLLGRRYFYFPKWLMRRSFNQQAVAKALRCLKNPASYIDRLVKPRLTPLTDRTGSVVIAIICLVMSLSTPLMELVPFSAGAAGLVLTMFGLSLLFRDGLLALIAVLLYCSVGAALWLGL
ncbi:exopolysaccharide biosynthesis protein [Spongiibacter nanhainus]|uniref:Exopolysaccharide biosynthesis protein n=1 Tax=Spongiibacter nanhainus TaxID=2794344 RepID=A0A7T4URM7_9GAMM|nr:exopolysaccharide biosynthesis protein [Spongiibacter nanhainus]QQD19983.1 exopolysaccharide biosynthesis protein [Spongiibacter nanhainus]